jgi:hypothetical protein
MVFISFVFVLGTATMFRGLSRSYLHFIGPSRLETGQVQNVRDEKAYTVYTNRRPSGLPLLYHKTTLGLDHSLRTVGSLRLIS